MANAKKVELIEIKPIEEAVAMVRVVGDSPLITHAWDAKAKREILEKELNITRTKKRDPKNPVADFCASMYWLTPMPETFTDDAVDEALKTARFGFPVTGFKQAAISAAYRLGWAKDKMSLRGAFFIVPDANGYYAGDLRINSIRTKIDIIPNVYLHNQLIEIKGSKPVMRQDMVRVGMGSADIRYRAEFSEWYCDMQIRYNLNGDKTLDQIINILNAGGYACGVGEWRPERDGQNGCYHIELLK
jgi:hypothetical protein